jgi:hypothetical protein
MEIKSIGDFRKAIRNGKFAWPGGYPMFFVMDDGEAISFEAAKAERRNILEALAADHAHDGWKPVAFEINWEDADLYCAHTGKRIESAYAEPEEVNK